MASLAQILPRVTAIGIALHRMAHSGASFIAALSASMELGGPFLLLC